MASRVKIECGKLYIVATPIGNLGDITLRALETLKSVDIIACENRTHHLKLLNHFEIKKHLIEYSPANEENSAKGIVKLLQEGKNIALVSDAGVPTLSDPGKILIKKATEAQVEIIPIPGVSALTTIMPMIPFPSKNTVFLGFLPKSESKIKKQLLAFTESDSCLIVYVSSHQIKKFLPIVNNIYGNTEIIIGREMTKLNEEFIHGLVEEIIANDFSEAGEFTVAIKTPS